MVVKITLDLNSGQDLGPFNLTANVGSVSPGTATRAQLLQGLNVTVDSTATQVTVTSTGDCTNATTVNITGIPVSETYYELEPCQGGAPAYTLIEPVLTDQRYVLPGTPDIFYTPTGESLTQSTAPSGFNSNIQPVVGETGCPPQATLKWFHTFQPSTVAVDNFSRLTIAYEPTSDPGNLILQSDLSNANQPPVTQSGTLSVDIDKNISIEFQQFNIPQSLLSLLVTVNSTVVDGGGTTVPTNNLGTTIDASEITENAEIEVNAIAEGFEAGGGNQ